MSVFDPAFAAVDATWKAMSAYDAACAADTEGNGETPEVEAASRAFHASWKALCRISPTTLDGVRAIARCAIEIDEDMGSNDYRNDALVALAMLLPTSTGGAA